MANLQELGKSLASVGSLLKGRLAKAGLTIVFVGSLFTAIGVVSSAWDTWGLPRFAYASEVKELNTQIQNYMKETNTQIRTLVDEGKTTRDLLYYTRKDALAKELTQLETRLLKEPGNVDLRQRITSIKNQLELINKNLDLVK